MVSHPVSGCVKWSEMLKAKAGSNFDYKDIIHAGQFWREPGVARELQEAVGHWAREMVILGSDKPEQLHD